MQMMPVLGEGDDYLKYYMIYSRTQKRTINLGQLPRRCSRYKPLRASTRAAIDVVTIAILFVDGIIGGKKSAVTFRSARESNRESRSKPRYEREAN